MTVTLGIAAMILGLMIALIGLGTFIRYDQDNKASAYKFARVGLMLWSVFAIGMVLLFYGLTIAAGVYR